MNSIKKCFDVILTADRKESRVAARSVHKVTFSTKTTEDYSNIKDVITNAGEIYSLLREPWRQEDFVHALSIIYFLRSDEEDLDENFPWFFHLLQDTNGRIRYAAVKMLCHDLGPLTVHIRCPEFINKEMSKRDCMESDRILRQLFSGLEILLQKTWESKHEKYTFVSDMPSSPYKSAQMVMVEMMDLCGEEYIKEMS